VIEMAEENYKSSTGVEEFYYALIEETGAEITTSEPSRVKFIQNITVEMPQEAVRAYGDNTTAEIAVSNGNITVNGAFHTLPHTVKEKLLGLTSDTNGLIAHGSSDNPPYVACVFAKTYEDGSKEWVGLTKGMFMRPNISAQSKQESTEFSAEEISGAFMDREVAGFDDEKSVVFARDVKSETTQRDFLFQAIFGQDHPDVVEGV
jgi:phi13 family phage major tail protein